MTCLHCAVWGMPGIGKSQLALAYAQQEFLSSTYDLIVWLSGTAYDKIVEGLTDALILLEHPARAETDVKARSNAFQRTSPQGGLDCRDLLVASAEVGRRLGRKIIPTGEFRGRHGQPGKLNQLVHSYGCS